MNWDEALSLIKGEDWKSVRAGSRRMRELMKLLGDPQNDLNCIHIAGTNGKGSAAAMLSAILKNAGYTTGRYISPHLIRVNERICINDTEISDQEFTDIALTVRKAADSMIEKPTIFELLTAAAFLYFKQRSCDIVVLEVGLGGRLDATNIIGTPLVSLIMHIGLEHTEQLGNTVEEIAYEKAGIVKHGGFTVLYAQSDAVTEVIRKICEERDNFLTITDMTALCGQKNMTRTGTEASVGQTFTYRGRENICLSLLGSYQLHNAAVVLDAVDILKKEHGLTISEEAVRTGLGTVNWPGRFQILCADPLILLDGAHNPNGVEALSESIRSYVCENGKRLILLMGVMADKDYGSMLDILAGTPGMDIALFIAQAPESSRSLSPDQLRKEIEKRFGCAVVSCSSIAEGLKTAYQTAKDEQAKGDKTVILAFGSLYQAGEILEIVNDVIL
ncbi:MAG: bifunctional folylpolyglutamate synthase/dihydrofolate synthase [Lachnospiraceae bacterium]|nr:bifunctional folylpolyglutamate synthase/dihydrofolate synthase [Lachnospiraceae bacterium]